MGIEIPQEYGGAGSTFFNSILAIEEMAKVDSAMGGMIDLQNTVINTILLHNASPEQIEKYAPKLATNMVCWSLCLVFLVFYIVDY